VQIEDEKAQYARNHTSDVVGKLKTCIGNCAFNVGVLMGAKLMGASHEQMTRMGMNIYRSLIRGR